MLRSVSILAAFSAILILSCGSIDAQIGGKKPADPQKNPEGKKADDKKAVAKKDADGRTKEGPTYFPLNVGNRWEYTLTANDKTLQMTSKISRLEMVKGVPLAVFETEVEGRLVASEHLRLTDQGVLRFKSGQSAMSPAQNILKSPVKADDKWNGTTLIGKNKITYSVETEAEEIEVPAGTFKTIKAAFKIEAGVKASVTTTWYAENVGIVKQMVDGGVVAVLERFEVKAGPDVAGNPAKQIVHPVHYPLAVGNRWEYDLTANGNTGELITKIARTETIDGIRLFVLEVEGGGKVSGTEHLRQTANGVFRYRAGNFAPTPPFLLIKTPLKANDKWKGAMSAGKQRVNYNSETAEEEIEVPAGKFKCVRVKTSLEENGKAVATTWWFAENVGYVKQVIDTDGLNIVAELRKYDVKSPAAAVAEVDLKGGIAAPYPLIIGTRWVYDVTAGNEKSILTRQVKQSETINKAVVFAIESEVNGKKVQPERLQVTDQGVVRHGDSGTSTSPVLVAKAPLKAGDKWNGKFAMSEKEKGSYAIETAIEDIEVPLGAFKTIRVKMTITNEGKSLVSTTWYANDIGPLKRVEEIGGRTHTIVLREFELGAGQKE